MVSIVVNLLQKRHTASSGMPVPRLCKAPAAARGVPNVPTIQEVATVAGHGGVVLGRFFLLKFVVPCAVQSVVHASSRSCRVTESLITKSEIVPGTDCANGTWHHAVLFF